jgi:hypothetical protein
MNDKFDYVYKQHEIDEPLTWRNVIETVAAFLAMAVCLVALMMLFLCGG